MNWTDNEIEAEAAQQEQVQIDRDALEAQVAEWRSEGQEEWVFEERESDRWTPYQWVHRCGYGYYQLDRPDSCYLNCDDDHQHT